MKALSCVALVASILACEAWAETNYITFTNGQYRLVAGHASLPGLPASASVNVVWPVFTYNLYFTTIGWNGLLWGLDPLGKPPSFAPGKGFIIRFKAAATLVLPDPPSPVLPLQLAAGYSLVCCQSNVPATFEMIVGRAPDEGTKIYRWLEVGVPSAPVGSEETNYSVYTFSNGSWSPEGPIADIGEAVWVYQPPVISNPKVVGNQFTFDALTGWGSITDVEYSDTLPGESNWLVLTNFSGYGGITNVLDSTGINVTTQRFYRLKMLKGPG